ncbi:non-ribosomal peptide synthetase [Wenjunlia tyrosinilytica]|uniref:Carrier domain-containing protein n=1 Tax=Wenjunlia tyrosinilytica TaxID=1544741 RepID=A0A917ZVC6_9ACTN|nr:non-ribosomal peptide synthetase [Wenjunlia tyrosinilytica]GGO96051.1 hypothetical protein GCM10012280_54690 [Wenjunlia tyrosinilytica]
MNDAGFRLSPQQAHTWQHVPKGWAQCRISLEGPSAADDVARAVRDVVRRHESLRARLATVPGIAVPLQTVDEETELAWVEDVLPGDAAAAAAAVEQAAAEDRTRPLGGAMRARLLSGTDHAELVLTAPGVFLDRRSFVSVFEELAARLGGSAEDDEPLQYLDAAEWLHEQAATADARNRMAAWNRHELAAARVLPTPFEGGTADGVGVVQVPSDPPWAQATERVAAELGCSLGALVLGAWQLLLWRLTAAERLVTGFVPTTRGLDELDAVVGNFASPVPVLSAMEPGMSFEALVARLDRAMGEASTAQFSFDGTAAEGTAPFGYSFCELPAEASAGRLRLALRSVATAPVGATLHLDAACTPDGWLDLRILHDTRLVSERHAARLAGQFGSVLRSVTETPRALIGDLALADQDETARVLGAGTGPLVERSLLRLAHARFERCADERPERLAVVCGGQRLTYGEVEARANRLAHALRSARVGPDVPVALMVERSVDYVVGLLAVLKAGGAFVPIDPGLPAERIAQTLAEVRPAVAITHRGLTGFVAAAGVRVLDLDDAAALAAWPATRAAATVHPENLAYVIFTSGSTDRPKGVAMPHRAICGYVEGVLPEFCLGEDAVLASLATPAADLGHTAVFGALCTGRSLLLAAPEEVLASDLLARRFREQPVDLLKIVPSHLAALLGAQDAADLLPRSCLVLGGEELTAPLVEQVRRLRPGLRVIDHYGPTETAVGALVSTVADRLSGPIPIGTPLPNYRAWILDARLRPVLQGAPGELYIAGDGVARGYWEQPGRTAERFLPDPFAVEPGSVMYRTGDLARQRPDGAVVFLGRADDQVKIRGNRVELGDIETVLRRDKRLADAAVVARDDGAGMHLVAYVAPRRGTFVQGPELAEELRCQLPEYMVPGAIVALQALPLTPNGKLDRSALPAPDPSASRTAPYVAPRTGTETLLAEVWEDILGCGKVGSRDDFFRELGGNSLDATRAVARVRAATGVALQVSALFEAPTVAALAEQVEAGRAAASVGGASDAITPVDRTGPLPLSYAQRRIWMLSQVDGANTAYNIPAAIRIGGPLDIDVLVRALGEVVARHEALRTNFVQVDGVPAQVVREAAPIEVPMVDIRATDVAARAQAHASRPFDLERDELFRAAVLRVSAEEHVLLLCLHHIVSDGWSTTVLWQEIASLYTNFRAGQESPLKPLPSQYADFAAWQNRWLDSPEIAPQLTYWTRQLDGLPALLELPTDRPRPSLQGGEGATLAITVPSETVLALRGLSVEQRATMFMVMLTAFNVLLARYTGQHDIAVGTPVANRTRAEAEGLIGCFFNTLVIRTDLSDDPTFSDLLGRVRDVVIAALAHQDLPFERLVEVLNPARSPAHTPLFQTLFVYQPAPAGGAAMDGLRVERLALPGTVAKYDLTLDLVEDEDGVRGRIEYRTDLFDCGTIERMAGHFTRLLDAIVRDPMSRVAELDLLTGAERELVLAEWNSEHRAQADGLPVADAFEERVRSCPDATALVFGDRSLTYRELDRAANRLACRLRAKGVSENVLVGLWTERSIELVVAMLAVLKAGGAYVPLDPAAPTARVAVLVEDARIGLVIAPTARAAELPPGVDVVAPEVGPSEEVEPAMRTTGPESLAYVIYTSGSTGRPKGVMVAQRNLVSFFAAIDSRLDNPTPGTWLALTHHTFDISVLELLWTLTRGFKVVLVGDELVLSAPPRPAGTRPVDFSLFYFASDAGERGTDKYRLLLEGAQWADEHGFAAVWTPERHFGAFGGLYPNPGITAAALAASTTRIGIRTGSLVLPLHNPIRVAEDWAVIDNLSNGRVGLSIASGWQPHDFALAPHNFADRKEVMFRDLEVVRSLWRGEAVRAISGTGEEIEVRTLPRPVQPELSVWVTAAGNPETFRRAGTVGANVLTHLLGQSVEEMAGALEVYRAAWSASGRPGRGHVTLMLHTFVSDDEEYVRRTVREPFKNYLRQSADLVRPVARDRGLDVEGLDQSDLDALLDHAYDRYFGSSGLFGTPRGCAATVDRVQAAGVDEIACLVDFGVAEDEVLASLEHLDELRRITSAGTTAEPRVDIAGLIEQHSVSHLQCTPSLAALLAADVDARAALRRLDWLLVGGEALPHLLAEKLSAAVDGRVLNVYGPTEATIWSTSHLVSGADNSIGRPLSNTRTYVLDERCRPVPVGVPGELCIGGDGVAVGYLHRPELTAERFVTDPYASDPAARMYRTGDIVRHRPGGELEFIGRRDHQVKIHGFRVELGEIEAALGSAPGVQAGAVVADDDGRGGKRLVAHVVMFGPFQAADLRRHLEEQLPRHMVPARIVELESMPLLPSGKVDRSALPGVAADQPTNGEAIAPSTPTERELARIWAELLKQPTIGAHDNFFELGGDSIIAIQLVARARHVGLTISARDLFRHQTLTELAAVAREGTTTHAEQDLVLGEGGLAPIQHWFFEQELADPHHYNQAILVDVTSGRLDLGSLACARDALLRHHDSLRNRFVHGADGWRQWTGAPEPVPDPVDCLDLTDLPPAAWPEAVATMQRDAHGALDLVDGPMLRMVYLDFGAQRADQLFVVAHHTVVDGISWRILMEDLQTAYEAERQGRGARLPLKTTSYQEWVCRLTADADSARTRAELDYWADQIEPPTAALPRDRAGENTEGTVRRVRAEFTADETIALVRDLPAGHRIGVPELLLTALADACAPWTGSRSLLVDVEGHGREELFDDIDVSRTVGWFSAIYPLRITLAVPGEDSLRAVREQIRAVPRSGVGFGLLRHLSPDESVRARLRDGRRAELVFNYLGQADASLLPDSIFQLSGDPVGAPHGPAQRRRHLVNVNGIVVDGRLRVDFAYSQAVHDPTTVEALVARFTAATRELLGECLTGGVRFVPSDFPDIDLTQGELEELLTELES